MANLKKGLNYYTVDTDRYQDIRILRLKKNCGCQGLAVYDYILSEIYRIEGSVLEWDENRAFHVADYFGLKETQVNEIVKYCASVGLFDKALLCRGIVTSASIQQRYFDLCSRARRQKIVVPKEYLLIQIPEESHIITEESDIMTEESDIITEESHIITEESHIITEECEIITEESQKLKENKEKDIKENKEKEEEKEKPSLEGKKKETKEDAAKAATLSRKNSFYDSLVPFLGTYDKIMIREFFDYWSELNRSQTKMRFEQERTWEISKRLATWARREKDFKPKTTYQEQKQQEQVMARQEREDETARREAQWEERQRQKVSRAEFEVLLARAQAGDMEAKKLLRL